MPSTTKRQQRYMGMEYAAAKRGERTVTGMSKDRLREFAKGPVKKKGRAHKMRPKVGRP